MELWLLLMIGIGLLVGSVLSCLTWRSPKMLQCQALAAAQNLLGLPPEHHKDRAINLFFPRSCCPICRRCIAFYHNIPLLSWLWLRGHCHYCQHPISWRYPVIELVAAASSGWVAFNWPLGITALALVCCGWLLILLAAIDFETLLLPDCLTLPLLWLGLLINLNDLIVPLDDAVTGALLGYITLWAVYWIFKIVTGKEGIGYGDFKLLAALGAWCGWQSLPQIVLFAALMAIVICILLPFLGRKRRDLHVAFGPYLSLSGWWVLTGSLATG